MVKNWKIFLESIESNIGFIRQVFSVFDEEIKSHSLKYSFIPKGGSIFNSGAFGIININSVNKVFWKKIVSDAGSPARLPRDYVSAVDTIRVYTLIKIEHTNINRIRINDILDEIEGHLNDEGFLFINNVSMWGNGALELYYEIVNKNDINKSNFSLPETILYQHSKISPKRLELSKVTYVTYDEGKTFIKNESMSLPEMDMEDVRNYFNYIGDEFGFKIKYYLDYHNTVFKERYLEKFILSGLNSYKYKTIPPHLYVECTSYIPTMSYDETMEKKDIIYPYYEEIFDRLEADDLIVFSKFYILRGYDDSRTCFNISFDIFLKSEYTGDIEEMSKLDYDKFEYMDYRKPIYP